MGHLDGAQTEALRSSAGAPGGVSVTCLLSAAMANCTLTAGGLLAVYEPGWTWFWAEHAGKTSEASPSAARARFGERRISHGRAVYMHGPVHERDFQSLGD